MIRDILAASRPVSWVNTAFPFAMAYVIVHGRWDWLLIVGTVFFLVPYNIAMYGINDVFDYESDIRNPRKGSIEGALLPPSMHRPLLLASAVTTLPFLVVLLASGTWASAAWLILSAIAVVAYSAQPFRFKEVLLLDSVTSAAHFTTPALVGATIREGTIGPIFWVAAAAFFVWGIASHAFGAVQDVLADREAGLKSIATEFGAQSTTRLAATLYLACSLMLFTIPPKGWIVGLVSLGYVLNTAHFWNVTDMTSPATNAAWRVFIWLNFATGAIVTLTIAAALT